MATTLTPVHEASVSFRKEPLPGLPDMDYPAPLIVRRTFIDLEVDRPASLADFWADRNIQSCPPGRIAITSSEIDPPKSGDAPILHEAGATATARSRSTSIGSSASELSTFLPSKTTPAARVDVAEQPGQPDAETAIAGSQLFASVDFEPQVWRHEVATPSMGRGGAWWPSGIPCPPCEPPLMSSPSLPEPEAPPVPSHAATRTLLNAVPVLLLSEAVSQPVPGTPELPSVGSAGHATGTCKPCAYFAHSRGCANGVQCPFCHLCPPGELKRRQKEMRSTRPRTQQSSWQAVSAYHRRRDWAGKGHA